MRRNRIPDWEVLSDPERHPEEVDPDDQDDPSLFDEGSDDWLDEEGE